MGRKQNRENRSDNLPQQAPGASPQPEPTRLAPRRPAAPLTAPQLHPAEIVADDDAVIVPAPTIDVFAPRKTGASPGRTGRLSSLALRRTLIPILLTNGILLPLLGASWFLAGEDSPFRLTGAWFPCLLSAVGILLLGLGLLNMRQVRDQLGRGEQPAR